MAPNHHDDTTVGGFDVRVGTGIFLNFASAHRQTDIWDDPDTFDIHRPNANRHIAFGKALRPGQLSSTDSCSRCWPNACPHCDSSSRSSTTSLNIKFRGPEQLHLAWD